MSTTRVPRHSISRVDTAKPPSTQLYSLINDIVGISGPHDLLGPVSKLEFDDKTTAKSLEQLITQKPDASFQTSAQEFEQEIEHFNQLHNGIEQSVTMLDTLEDSLKAFQGELNSLSADMEVLQNRSLNHRKLLESRKQAEARLAPLVEALVIPPTIINQIADLEISPQWRAALKYLIRRKNELKALKGQEGFAAIEGAETQLDLVSRKAVERIRDYMASRIRMLRSAGVNAQAIQGDLLANKELYAYLFEEHTQLALDLRQAYLFTMRWYYASNFSRYVKSLERLPIVTVDKSVVLGSDETARKGFFATSRFPASSALVAPSPHGSSLSDYLSLNDRANVLSSNNASVISSHAAETAVSKGHTSWWLDSGFRSVSYALVDNATVEYRFLEEFFKYERGEQPSAIFNAIFEPTFNCCYEYTRSLVETSFDGYGVLISIRLSRKFELELQKRKTPVCQDFFQRVLMTLWPRFQSIMDAHCEGLRKASSKSTSFTATTSSQALVPHAVTQQYASFLFGILTLCETDESKTEPVANSIHRLRNDFESFLTKMSGVLNDSSSKQEKFLYNNYFLVSTIISDVKGALAEQEKEHFRLLTEAYQGHRTAA